MVKHFVPKYATVPKIVPKNYTRKIRPQTVPEILPDPHLFSDSLV